MLIHDRWTKSGRVFRDDSDPKKFIWKSFHGQKNVLDGNEHKPYIWNESEKKIKCGDIGAVIDFSADKAVAKIEDKEIFSGGEITVEKFENGNWKKYDQKKPVISIQHNIPKDGKATIWLDHPSADFDLRIGYVIGGGDVIRQDIHYRSSTEDVVRFTIVLKGLTKLTDNADGHKLITSKNGKTVGVRFGELVWRWGSNEADQRTLGISNTSDKKDFTLTLGDFKTKADEWLIISPDTWGPTTQGWGCWVSDDGSKDDTDQMWTGAYNSSGAFRGIAAFEGVDDMFGYEVTKVELDLKCRDIEVSPGDIQIVGYGDHGADDAEEDSNTLTWTRSGQGKLYCEELAANISAYAWLDTQDLGSNGVADLQETIDDANEWWAFCFKLKVETGYSAAYNDYEFDQTYDPAELTVTYTEGPPVSGGFKQKVIFID